MEPQQKVEQLLEETDHLKAIRKENHRVSKLNDYPLARAYRWRTESDPHTPFGWALLAAFEAQRSRRIQAEKEERHECHVVKLRGNLKKAREVARKQRFLRVNGSYIQGSVAYTTSVSR